MEATSEAIGTFRVGEFREETSLSLAGAAISVATENNKRHGVLRR